LVALLDVGERLVVGVLRVAFAEAGGGIAACVYDWDEDGCVTDSARSFGTGGSGSGVEVLWGWGGESEMRHDQHGGREENGVHFCLLQRRKKGLAEGGVDI
jgi:hypothetical protein